ncbi:MULTISPECIES: hypothetical protein [unclassified Sphingopyxis]|uniref:hypothetical protein n=1 Tax=unclassified Sphingopyxis TaxID=2614943 RepID=UPI00285D4AC5|nr:MULTISPECIES: hypothetical protein [unclassified Sphingopyxis]MDR7061215.1 hypothetical protein [Sphingopyxis sp. BE235]MDR7182054.1 hypothetical protein [Sphingopyxis sp. BE249]
MLDFTALSCTPPERTIPEIVGVNGPELWDQILAFFPGAVIGGGAVRDYLLGVEPKDIDVFAYSADLDIPTNFASLDSDRREEYEALGFIDIVTRATLAGYQVDLVGINMFSTPDALIESFDFGVSRCAYTTERGIIDTPECRSDRENRTVSILLDDRLIRGRRRFERFNDRMGGDWTLIEDAA